ncbi:hypothetical protein FRB90_008863, partial [Tulasnella sp. 427]
ILQIGCPTSYEQEGDQVARICPRCHNASVVATKSKTKLEICCVPLFPISSKRVWMCGICQWEVPMGDGYEPPYPNQAAPGQWSGQPQWGQQQWGPGSQQGGYGSPQYPPNPGPNMQGGPGQYRQY